MGLYSVLWGKHKESKENKEEEIPDAIKGAHQVNGNGVSGNVEDIEANGNIQMGKGEAENKGAAALSCCH